MWFLDTRRFRYKAVPNKEDTESIEVQWNTKRQNRFGWKSILAISVIAICATLSTVFLFVLCRRKIPTQNPAYCHNPRVRREWRTLQKSEQLQFIDSVKCLQQLPSKFDGDGSLYDDFPRTHMGVGLDQHEALSFLSWHRYFVATFESRLRSECGYEGPLPYWNWMLDHEDPALSPVFDNVYGFGGNGDINGISGKGPVGDGYCVVDGPFAGLTARYVGRELQPHCLSRNFRNDTAPGHFKGKLLRPDLTENILKEDDILKFLLRLERGPHNTIPQGIGGDFKSFTAPADPLFFLHHGQLDRLWWIWQNRKPERRTLYEGKVSLKSDTIASLSDVLEMQGLAPDLPVSEIIDTEGGVLCYTYDESIDE